MATNPYRVVPVARDKKKSSPGTDSLVLGSLLAWFFLVGNEAVGSRLALDGLALLLIPVLAIGALSVAARRERGEPPSQE